jgi:Ca2+-binding EF-hand superfamily protein
MWAEMFNALDADHNGFVDIDELKDDMDTVLKGETRTGTFATFPYIVL